MWGLAAFGVDDLEAYSKMARGLGAGAGSMEQVGQRIVQSLYDQFEGPDGTRAFSLVRFYKTHRFDQLPPALQEFATSVAPAQAGGALRCLTLLATIGEEEAWCDRRLSAGHQAIPLESAAAVGKLPMVARLVTEMGLDLEEVVAPQRSARLAMHHRRYDVFYVAEARESQWVPAQDFVREHGIRSVFGCGGVLPSGDLFAVMCFARCAVPRRVADLFGSVALAFKAALVAFSFDVFESAEGAAPSSG